MPEPLPNRTRERTLGLLLIALGAGMLWTSWGQAVPGETFSGPLAAMGPMVTVLGLGLAAVPGPRAERRAKGLPEPPGGEMGLTPRWKGIAVAAVVAALVHVWLVSQGLVPHG